MHKFKYYFIFFIALFCFNSSFSQNTGTHKAFLSLYGGTFSNFADKGLFGPAAGFGWQNKKQNWHEVELDFINFNKGYAFIWFKYQHSIILFKNAESAFKPFIGLGLEEASQYNKTEVYTGYATRQYYTSFNNFSGFYVSPGVQFTSKKIGFYCALQLPTDLATLNSSTDKSPLYSGRNSEVEFNVVPFNRLMASISFGYKF